MNTELMNMEQRRPDELIRVTFQNDRPAVSARELHEFLEVETPYHKWFPRMCEYGFTENQDYAVTDIFVHNPAGGPQSKKDAAVSIDMAKEICMFQRNEKGKVARQYFIQLEKDWNSPEKVMARALRIAEKQISELESKIKADKPLTDFAKSVSDCLDAVTVGEYAKLLHDRDGIDIGRNRLYKWLRYNGYLMEHNEPYQTYITDGTFVSILTSKGGNLYPITLVTGKGMVKLFPKIAEWWDKSHPAVKKRKPLELDEINRYILEAKPKGCTERQMAAEIGTITNIAVHKRIDKLREVGLLDC